MACRPRDRDIAGAKGAVRFADMFDDQIKWVGLSMHDAIPVGKTVTWRGALDLAGTKGIDLVGSPEISIGSEDPLHIGSRQRWIDPRLSEKRRKFSGAHFELEPNGVVHAVTSQNTAEPRAARELKTKLRAQCR